MSKVEIRAVELNDRLWALILKDGPLTAAEQAELDEIERKAEEADYETDVEVFGG